MTLVDGPSTLVADGTVDDAGGWCHGCRWRMLLSMSVADRAVDDASGWCHGCRWRMVPLVADSAVDDVGDG